MSLMMFLLAFFYKCKHLTRLYIKSIPTTWVALFRKCSKAAKIAFGIKLSNQIVYILCAQRNFGAKRLIFVMM